MCPTIKFCLCITYWSVSTYDFFDLQKLRGKPMRLATSLGVK